MMSDSVTSEHTDERSVVSDAHIHDDQSVVTSHQQFDAVCDQWSRCGPTVLDQEPHHAAATVMAGRRQAAGRQVSTVEM